MSVWTHVLGTIRFDNHDSKPILKPDFGVYCSPEEEDDSVWDNCIIPCGTEGSLHIELGKELDNESVARHIVLIFGGLRDYDDEQAIIDYFNKITENLAVRRALFTLEVSGKTSRTFVWKLDNTENEGFVEVF